MERPANLPGRNFTAEEIKEDERRRDRELYGPPTPRPTPQEITAMVYYSLHISFAWQCEFLEELTLTDLLFH